MNFIQFAADHGLIINHLEIGKWARVPTVDHPRKKNGSYRFLGDVGFVQNFATMPSVAMWKEQGINPIRVDPAAIARRVEAARQELATAQRNAASKAESLLKQSFLGMHPYLERKGFPKERGNIVMDGDARILYVPMRVGRMLAGVQSINEAGEKRFLSGQRTKGAEFVIGAGRPILCEGYATGLSLRAALATIPRPHSIHICFSAGNLQSLSAEYRDGLVIADHDASGTGERVAKASGLPYWMPEAKGEDFNDYHQRAGLYAASEALRKALRG